MKTAREILEKYAEYVYYEADPKRSTYDLDQALADLKELMEGVIGEEETFSEHAYHTKEWKNRLRRSQRQLLNKIFREEE